MVETLNTAPQGLKAVKKNRGYIWVFSHDVTLVTPVALHILFHRQSWIILLGAPL